MLQTLVVVVHRHRQSTLGRLLADDVVVKIGFDFDGGGQIALAFAHCAGRQFVSNDVIAQINAFIANENRGAGNQFFDFVLALTAKRAVQRLFARGCFFIGHSVGTG